MDRGEIIEKLAGSEAAPADLSVSNEGTAGATFGGPQGAFMVNWTYIWTNYDNTQPEVKRTSASPDTRARPRARHPDHPTAASASA